MPDISLIGASFIAGLLMFLAPCTLPLVPAFLSFISGVKADVGELSAVAKRKIRINALAYVLGFSLVFISFGVLAGALGGFIGTFRGLLSQVGGVFIILFGLIMLDVVRFTPLRKNHALRMPKTLTPGRPLSAALIGIIFALGWTPCVGPVLASVLLLASTSATAVTGAVLLAIFSLGLAIPFLAVAFLYSQLADKMARLSVVSSAVSTIGGVFLIGIGILLLSGSFGLMVQYGYVLFDHLGLNMIFDHL